MAHYWAMAHRLKTSDLFDLTSREQTRTKEAVDHITSSQNKPHNLSIIDKLYTL